MSRKIISLALLLSWLSVRAGAAEPEPCLQPAPDLNWEANIGAESAVYVQAEALFWDRIGTGSDQVLAVDVYEPLPGEDTRLTTGELDFNYEPGLRVLIGWRPNRCCDRAWCSAWELSYFGVYDWSASAAAAGDNNLMFPPVAGLVWNNFGLADEIRAVYHSELHNVELNCIKSCCFDPCTRIDFLCGFRFLAMPEELSLIGTDGDEGISSYDISTENYLYGLQMGGRVRRSWQRWAVEVTGKAGVFVNDAGQSQMVTDFPDNPSYVPRPLIGSDGQNAAALGELGVTLIRRLTDVWSLRIGYQALGIGGVALAPNQLDFSDPFTGGSKLQKDGYVFLHGVNVGVEACW